MDDFSPPESDLGSDGVPAGVVDAGAALSTGLSAFVGNLFHAIAVYVLMTVAFVISCCSLVLWIPVYPMLFWGVAHWALSAVDGKSDITLLWTSVLEDPMVVFLRGWAWFGLLILAFIPLYVVMIPLSMMSQGAGDLAIAMAYGLAMQVPTFLFMLVMIRYYQSFWVLVERRATTLDAISLGWSATARSWVPLAGLMTLYMAIGLPYQVLIQWQSYELQQLPPSQILNAMGPFYAVVYGGGAVMGLVGMAVLLVFAAAHRQLFPAPPTETV